MPDYAISLGNAVKHKRKEIDLTQVQVADLIDVDARTIMNIENFKGNPKLEILYPLIRMLNIDAQEVFYPELQQESPHLRQLMQLMSDCSDQEAETLIPIIQTILTALRSKEYLQIK